MSASERYALDFAASAAAHATAGVPVRPCIVPGCTRVQTNPHDGAPWLCGAHATIHADEHLSAVERGESQAECCPVCDPDHWQDDDRQEATDAQA